MLIPRHANRFGSNWIRGTWNGGCPAEWEGGLKNSMTSILETFFFFYLRSLCGPAWTRPEGGGETCLETFVTTKVRGRALRTGQMETSAVAVVWNPNLKMALAFSSTSFTLSVLVREAPASAPPPHPPNEMHVAHRLTQIIGEWRANTFSTRTREQQII